MPNKMSRLPIDFLKVADIMISTFRCRRSKPDASPTGHAGMQRAALRRFDSGAVP